MSTAFVNIQDSLDPKSPDVLREVEIPNDYYRVWRGALRPGDLHLNMVLIRDNITEWLDAYPPETGKNDAGWYSCLIRRGTSVDKTCEFCFCRMAIPGWKCCEDCREKLRINRGEESC